MPDKAETLKECVCTLLRQPGAEPALHDRRILVLLSFLVLTVLCGLVTLLAMALPSRSTLVGGLGNLLTTLWTLLLFTLHGQVGAAGFRRLGLPLGNLGRGFKIALSQPGPVARSAISVSALLTMRMAIER